MSLYGMPPDLGTFNTLERRRPVLGLIHLGPTAREHLTQDQPVGEVVVNHQSANAA